MRVLVVYVSVICLCVRIRSCMQKCNVPSIPYKHGGSFQNYTIVFTVRSKSVNRFNQLEKLLKSVCTNGGVVWRHMCIYVKPSDHMDKLKKCHISPFISDQRLNGENDYFWCINIWFIIFQKRSFKVFNQASCHWASFHRRQMSALVDVLVTMLDSAIHNIFTGLWREQIYQRRRCVLWWPLFV